MMKMIATILLLTITQPATQAPSSGGQLDLHSNWWTNSIGSSGNYLTEDFRQSVFIPVMKNIVQNLDKIERQQETMETTDNWMGILIAIAVIVNIMAQIYLHRKNTGN